VPGTRLLRIPTHAFSYRHVGHTTYIAKEVVMVMGAHASILDRTRNAANAVSDRAALVQVFDLLFGQRMCVGECHCYGIT